MVVVEDMDVAGAMVLKVGSGVGGLLVDEDGREMEGEDEELAASVVDEDEAEDKIVDEGEDAIDVEAVGISVTDRAADVEIHLPVDQPSSSRY